MKKLVFVVACIFFIAIFFDSAQSLTRVNPQGRPANPAVFNNRNRKPQPGQSSRMQSNFMPNMNNRGIPNDPSSLQRRNSISGFRQQSPRILDISLPGDTVLQGLKDIISSVPAQDFYRLSSKIDSFLSSSLNGNADDVEKARSILQNAQNCFKNVYISWSALYKQFFEKFPTEDPFSTVTVEGVQEKLDRLNLNKLQYIISIYGENGRRAQDVQTKSDLETFLNYIMRSKTLLAEMKESLTTNVLNQVEGLPKLSNLGKTNTWKNQELRNQSGSYNLGNQTTNDNLTHGTNESYINSLYNEGYEDFNSSLQNKKPTYDDLESILLQNQELMKKLIDVIKSSRISELLRDFNVQFSGLRSDIR